VRPISTSNFAIAAAGVVSGVSAPTYKPVVIGGIRVRAKMMAMDLEFVPNTPEEAGSRLQRESAHWRQVIDRLGLKIQ
jgi:hypothetical protein